MNIKANLKTMVNRISWRHVIPVLALTVVIVGIPDLAHAADANPISKITTYFTDIQTSLVDLVRILAIIGIMICAVGMFLGNAGDGIKKLLAILVAALVASYAAEWFGSLF